MCCWHNSIITCIRVLDGGGTVLIIHIYLILLPIPIQIILLMCVCIKSDRPFEDSEQGSEQAEDTKISSGRRLKSTATNFLIHMARRLKYNTTTSSTQLFRLGHVLNTLDEETRLLIKKH